MSPGIRDQLVAAWQAGVAAVHGETLLRRHSRLDGDHWCLELPGRSLRWRLPRRDVGRLRVIGAGKAAASLARGLEAVLGERISDGLVVVKHGHAEPLRRCRVLEAGHPDPDAGSAAAADALLHFVGGSSADDVYLVVLTGGSSALLAAPALGLALEDKARVSSLLMSRGATIQQLNVVRRHLSRIKGGQLARAMWPAASLTLAISDVLGDDPATIGSGPTVPDGSTYGDAWSILEEFQVTSLLPQAVVEHLQRGVQGAQAETPKPDDPALARADFVVVASLEDALRATADAGGRAGLQVFRTDEPLRGDTRQCARAFACRLRELAAARRETDPPLLLVAGGETTVKLRGEGRGGRCQEFAAVAAEALRGSSGLTLLAAGTDGTDGPTGVAGAFADGGTLARAMQRGVELDAALATSDSGRLLEAAGDLFTTGPTGTNVMDLVLGIAVTAEGSPRAGAVP